jgi:ribosomal protein S12 methylthiotransferase
MSRKVAPICPSEPQVRPTVGFVTLGCPKNQVDTEIMEGILEDHGFRIVAPEDAEILVVNTCGFIEDAQEESVDTILSLVQGDRQVVVVGCLVERFGRELAREIPEVETWIGLGEEHRIGEILSEHQKGLFLDGGRPVSIDCWERRRLVPRPYSYLKLAEGCSNRCSYCAIPLIRGSLRSRPLHEIVEEALLMLGAGVKEINLVAQDLTCWGKDLGEEGGLVSLLDQLDALPGRFWLRLLYLHPTGISRELVSKIAQSRHIVPYLEMPVQHVDPEVLKAMGRRGGAEAVERAVELAESAGLALRTTVLVGFPAETEKAFERLCDFLKAHSFWRVACFGYSPQKGTPAFGLEPLPKEEVRERLDEVLSLAEEIHWQANLGVVGNTLACLAEEECQGRVSIQAPEIDGVVHLEHAVEPGSLFEVEVRDTDGVDLYGVPVSANP